MYKKEMKKAIDFASKYNLMDLRTFLGYDGDYILQLDFRDLNEAFKVRDYIKSDGYDVDMKKLNGTIQLYCIYKDSEEHYSLKML